MRSFDIDQLRTFVVAADLRSFTGAGDALGATQSAVSLRISKLEERVGRPLLARTPRAVALTPMGARFLDHARAILSVHDAAWSDLTDEPETETVRIGVSEHAAGARLTEALASLKAARPHLVTEVVTGLSSEMRDLFDRGEIEAAVVRRDATRRDGEPLGLDPLRWAAAPGLAGPLDRRATIPLVAMRGPCGLKTTATRALDEAGIAWRFAFLGGSVLALQAAVQAGLGIGTFGTGQVPAGAAVLGPGQGMPVLPEGELVLHARLPGPIRRAVGAAFRT